MQTIIDEELAEKLAEKGYFYIMHRFQPERRLDFVKRMSRKKLIILLFPYGSKGRRIRIS